MAIDVLASVYMWDESCINHTSVWVPNWDHKVTIIYCLLCQRTVLLKTLTLPCLCVTCSSYGAQEYLDVATDMVTTLAKEIALKRQQLAEAEAGMQVQPGPLWSDKNALQ